MKCLVDNETKCFCEGVSKSTYDSQVLPMYHIFQNAFIIDSQAKFEAWVNNTSGNDYTHIIIIGGNGSGDNGEYETDTTINLTTTETKTIQGVKDAKIKNGVGYNGITYNTLPTGNEYWICDLTVECADNSGFNKCINLTNCNGISDTAGFHDCVNLTNCFGTGGSSGFYDCVNLTNCFGTGTYGFNHCNVVSHCQKGSVCSTAVFRDSYASWAENTTYACADTANGGFNNTNNT